MATRSPQRPPLRPNNNHTITLPSFLKKLQKHVPNSTQLMGFLTLVISGGILLLLTGLTLTAIILGLIFFTPLILISSPIWVPIGTILFIAIAGFLSLCGFGVSTFAAFSWVFRSRSKKKLRLLRLKGFQLALSFQDLCNKFFNTKTEIVVTQGDQDGGKIASMVREIGASTLVAGLHDQSFLYRLAMTHNHIASKLNCKVLAIKQPTTPMATRTRTIYLPDSTTNMDFSQIEIDALSVPEFNPPKIPYQVCPDPHSIIWRSGRSRRWTRRN